MHGRKYRMSIGTYLELGQNILCGRSKHVSSIAANKTRAWSKQTLRGGRNIPRATAERYLKHGWNTSRAPSKHNSSTIETYLVHDRIIPRAWSKHTSSTVKTYLEHGRNIPHTQSKHIPSTSNIPQVSWNIPRARSKPTLSYVENLTRAR